jgi:hypothetical protein
MNDVLFKPSLSVNSLLTENSSIDVEKFQLFLEAYYEWLQTTTITLNNVVGKFVVGETIIGSVSGTIGKVIQVTSTTLIVKIISERNVFDQYEKITGQTSKAISTAHSIKDNVIRASGNVLTYKNIETSIDKYVLYLKDELYPSIPANYYGDKRLIAKYFKNFFQSKGTEQSYRFLFRLLYDEEIEFYYPGQDILRISDGNFEKTQIIRTASTAYGYDATGNLYDRSIFLFLNRTVVGKTTGSLANVVDIKNFFVGSIEISEMTLKLVSDTFNAGETLVDVLDSNLMTNVYGIISGFVINDGGSGYKISDRIIISGDGSEAEAIVSSIQQSPINSLKINSIGHGYRLGTRAYIDNAETGGSGLAVEVTKISNTYTTTIGSNTYTLGEISKLSVINRGSGYYKSPTITLQDTIVSSAGLLTDKLIRIANPGINYGVGNNLIFTGGSGTSAAGIVASVIESLTFDLLFEDGFQMKADGSHYDIIKNEDWSVKGPIKRLELTNFGTGYTSTSLPLISISTTTGSDASLIVTGIQGTSANVSVDTANNIAGVGSIRAIKVTNFGINYTNANVNVSTVGDGNAVLTPIISGLGVKDGEWTNDDGKVAFKRIQDSYYYQDYSYVIKSGLTFKKYSDTIKNIVHPAGLQFFGEIQIFDELDVHSELVFNNINSLKAELFSNIIRLGILDSQTKYVLSFKSDKASANLTMNFANGVTNLLTGPTFNDPSISNPITHEYVLSNQSGKLIHYYQRLLEEYAEKQISFIQNETIDAYLVGVNNFVDLFLDVSMSENDVVILNLNPLIDIPGYGDTINNVTKTRISDTDASILDVQNKTVVSFEGNGFRYTLFEEEILNDYASSTISLLETTQFDIVKNSVYDKTIKASPSPLESGQSNPGQNSNRKNPSDVFRDEIVVKSQSTTITRSEYADLRLYTLEDYRLDSIIPGTDVISASLKFTDFSADSLTADSTYIYYKNVTGTVSSASLIFDQNKISMHQTTPISSIFNKNLSENAPIVIGSGTNFVSSFNLNDVLIANNELFVAKSISNSSFMVVDRLPLNAFSGVVASRGVKV